MPKLCKPTKEAIYNRIAAVQRHARIKRYEFKYPLPLYVFGLNKTEKTGGLTFDEIRKELINHLPPEEKLKKDEYGLYIYASNYIIQRNEMESIKP